MADEEDASFEELEEPEELEDDDVEDLDDEDVLEADAELVDPLALEDDGATVVDEVEEEKVPDVAAVVEEDDDDDEEDDDVDPDDVEAGLDVILKDRLVVPEDEEDEDEEVPDPEERVDPTARALAKRPGEFTCQSCFLVKHPSQLADATRGLCRDCV